MDCPWRPSTSSLHQLYQLLQLYHFIASEQIINNTFHQSKSKGLTCFGFFAPFFSWTLVFSLLHSSFIFSLLLYSSYTIYLLCCSLLLLFFSIFRTLLSWIGTIFFSSWCTLLLCFLYLFVPFFLEEVPFFRTLLRPSLIFFSCSYSAEVHFSVLCCPLSFTFSWLVPVRNSCFLKRYTFSVLCCILL